MLKTVEGQGTRPTTDRIKETLFNMISFEIEGTFFLDLFAGSGGIGIEALSRGASSAVFVENNRKAAACIRENLIHTHLADQALLLQTDVMTALSQLSAKGRHFDYIFMDPPYGKGWEQKVLTMLESSPLCDESTVIIVESDLYTEFSWLSGTSFRISREKTYKSNNHTFITKDVQL